MQHKQVLQAGCYSRNPEVAPADICQIIAKGAWTSCGSELIAVWSDIHHWCHRYMYIMILSCTFWITVDTFYTLPRTALSAFTPIHETWLPSGYLQRRQCSEANRWIKKVRISLRLVACLTGQATPDGHLTVTWRSPDGHLTVTWRASWPVLPAPSLHHSWDNLHQRLPGNNICAGEQNFERGSFFPCHGCFTDMEAALGWATQLPCIR